MKRVSILLFVLFCCSTPEKSSELYEELVYEESACVDSNCAQVTFTYPYFDPVEEGFNYLNVHIEQQLIQFLSFGESIEHNSLPEAVSEFLEKYVNFKSNYPDDQEWAVEVSTEVGRLDSAFISIFFESYAYTGGAHPNSFKFYLNFDRRTYKPIKNEELILNRTGLLKLAENGFREIYDIDPKKTLAQDGRFFLDRDKKVFLPAAMGFEGEDFVLYYNTYEIAPYAMGPTELRYKKSEVKNLINYIPED